MKPSLAKAAFTLLVGAAFFLLLYLPTLFLYAPLLGRPRDVLSLFAQLLRGAGYFPLLHNSLKLALGATALALLIGVPYALCLARVKMAARSLLTAASLVPLAIPPFLTAVVWIELCGANGLLTRALSLLATSVKGWHGGAAPTDRSPLPLSPFPIYSLGGAIWVLALCYFPCVVWVTTGALRNVDGALEDDARTHTSEWGVLRHVTLPLAMPSVLVSALLVCLLCLAEFGVPDLLQVRGTYQFALFYRFSTHYDTARAALMSLPLMACMVAAFAGTWGAARGKSYQSLTGNLTPPRDVDLGRGARWLGALVAAVVLVAVVAPLVSLLYHALPLDNFAKVWQSNSDEIRNTTLLAIAAATGGAALAFCGAVVIERVCGRWKELASGIALLPLAVPPAVIGVALIALYNREGVGDAIYSSSAIVVLGCWARFLPFAVFAVRGALQTLDVSLEESAQVEGASWGMTLRKITLPLSASGVAAAWLLLFVLSAGELPVTVLAHPPGGQTLAFTIASEMHFGHTPQVAAMGCMLAWLSAGAAVVGWWWRQREKGP